jgi:hypothetical protein
MHKRMSCKRVKQMMADIGVNDNHHHDVVRRFIGFIF